MAAPENPNERVVARNKRARHEYELLDELECGVQLVGSEVKSIRAGKVSIEEAYVRVEHNEVWLIACDVSEYPQANFMNHETKRVRKLLMRRREVEKFAALASQKGLTLVPLEVSLRRGFVKVKIALARGKKTHDKRETLKKQDAIREMRAIKR